MARGSGDDKRKYGSMATSYGRKKPKPSAGGSVGRKQKPSDSVLPSRRKGPNMAAPKPMNQIPYGKRPVPSRTAPKRRVGAGSPSLARYRKAK